MRPATDPRRRTGATRSPSESAPWATPLASWSHRAGLSSTSGMPEAASAATARRPRSRAWPRRGAAAQPPGGGERRAGRHRDGDPQEHAPGADAGHHPPPLQPADERQRGQTAEPRRRGGSSAAGVRRDAGAPRPGRIVVGGRGTRAHRCARGTGRQRGAAIGVWVDGHRTADDRTAPGSPGGRDRAGLRLLELLLAQLDPPDLPRQRLGQGRRRTRSAAGRRARRAARGRGA